MHASSATSCNLGNVEFILLYGFRVIRWSVGGSRWFFENWVRVNWRILAIGDTVQMNYRIYCDMFPVGVYWLNAGLDNLTLINLSLRYKTFYFRFASETAIIS